jgi:trehalose 2-sulfotransferase
MVQPRQMADEEPVRYVVDERLDLNHFGPLRKSYIIASSYRSGSQYLCWKLWQTGLLGAPSEVLNPTSELRVFMNRFKTSSPGDYIAALLARRTSRNGVFGMKAHFHHFQAFLNEYPELLDVLAPVTFVYISRDDRVAQAVSMAKALQTNAWTSRMEEGPKPVLHYDGEMIARCLDDIEQQDLAWRRWFEQHDSTPFQVTYSELTADPVGVVRSIVELLGVQNDEPDEISLPPAKKQADETNQEWIERFQREARGGPAHHGASLDRAPEDAAAGELVSAQAPFAELNFFDRYDRLIRSIPAGVATATGFLDVIRLRRQYHAIIATNRDLLANARVLDIMSSYGFWSLAALDAGAAYAVGVDPSPHPIDVANKNFRDYGVNPDSYRFINSEIFACLGAFQPEEFDLVLCHGFLEQCDVRQFFHYLRELRPKCVILDTSIIPGEGPILRFSVEVDQVRASNQVLSAPSHQLIMFLCDVFKFRWRLVGWRAMGISDWTGIHDYERDQRRTYILERC